MAGLVDRIAQMRNPFIYAVDIVGGLRALGLRGTRRTLVGNVAMSVGIGAGVTAVGAGAIEATGVVVDHGVADTLVGPQGAELVGVAMGISVLGGLIQSAHQISKEGQEARVRRRGNWLL